MSDLLLGTAGHVDHGKTALVEALTGVDTDRLPQEKARGISIELGFAQLRIGDRRLSLVDVPGHERFVRHMVAGAGGIDGYLLCVAADDGVMPQTREHMAVLRLLGVDDGVVAVTKTDVAPPAAAIAQAREIVGGGVEVVPVSVRDGDGLVELRAAIGRLCGRLRRRPTGGPARLFVDRTFTVPGAGTVVTGTLWGDPIRLGDRVAIHPGQARGRVRDMRTHDEAMQVADGGRVALNLAGVGRDDAPRGAVVVRVEDSWRPSAVLDVALTWLAAEPGPLTSRRRLQAFHGTTEVGATCILLEGRALAPGERGYVQLRLDRPVVALAGDRLVLRSADRRTVAGAVVVDPCASHHGISARAGDRLRAIERGTAQPAIVVPAPVAASVAREPESPVDPALVAAVLAAIAAGGLAPPAPAVVAADLGADPADVRAALGALGASGRLIAAGDMWFSPDALAAAVDAAVGALRAAPLGIGRLRDVWGVGRRHAVAIVAHLDRTGLTIRRGDLRSLRRSVAATEDSMTADEAHH